MLRFLYLLSLLLCIELSFCYNYIDEITERSFNKIGRNVRRDRVRRVRKPKERKSVVRQEYDYDRSPVEFDVASFIQPDEESIEDDEAMMRYKNKKRRKAKNYDYGTIIGMNLDESNRKREKSADYLNMGDAPSDLNINPPLFKDSVNSKHLNYNSLDDLHGEKYGHEKFRNIYKDDLLMDQNVVHSHEKKCTLKTIKFPFFSHNKSEPMKPKKNKKRKLFFFNGNRREKVDDIKMGDDPIIHYKMKRSFEERLCPACKKKYLTNPESGDDLKKIPKRLIHNSRQYFQNNVDSRLKEDVKTIRNNMEAFTDEHFDERTREKRDDRERQLKELEEVQRKIDNVEIHIPTFEKSTDKSVFKY
ncbi:uncharacterized protein LOC110381340 isoform X1 [Helicoverpa armigera]|uniref:Uncharacterized protein n=1 Tax=Helicoverpa armigera TaxID=29058 RepID=A0A2W1BCF7_HELAM|nr:uncharacterized protein LOC110381340 isoform X1 [Helicoverpa armigera]PZC72658.1 hypothetical protein B5X24_HaOG210769 [Helicoverpa armigera]